MLELVLTFYILYLNTGARAIAKHSEVSWCIF